MKADSISAYTASATSPPTTAAERNDLSRYYPHRNLWKGLGLMTLIAFGLALLFNAGRHPIWSEKFLVTFAYNFFYTTGLWLANGYPSEWLNRRVDWTRQPIKRFLLTIGLSIVLSLLVIIVVDGSFRVFYHHRPLSSLTWQTFVVPLLITVVVSLFMHSRAFLMGWRETAIRAERLQTENARAQADSLRRQLDPHFLFNSLNALTSLVEDEHDPARASRFIRQLSQVYRYVLDHQNQELVPLTEELAFAESYLFLQRTRLGEGVQVAMHLPPAAELQALLVPPLALQLLLENALKHNATSRHNPLRLVIEFDAEARQLVVRNSRLPRLVAEAESTGLGLSNLQARYAFLTPKPVLITQSETEFVVTLPVLELR
ncbi:histidine kinase [Hymenobacter sp. ISL-91]|uniref:sensor histidine kinase n=1 Tax=Hymenobacter sp. ISL-91 TaxID=2819151 RepID=UPI001BE82408|nr:histidine kinase [Hymenobacter sp. ISL-91]MBT2557203.1 histidine kinase [Hymenobacter sp. ISL-91]